MHISSNHNVEPLLEVRNLSVRLPASSERQFAVRDVSFSLRSNEILCVVGESGSGKSVIAHSILGLLDTSQLQPVEGSICFRGENILSAAARRIRRLRGREISMIFQEPMTALNPVIPVGAQIEEVLRIHTRLASAERRRLVLEAMKEVLLPDPEAIVDRYPHQLSGGQRQRIMIAAALILQPSLLIADEPTTALDVTTQAQILKIIKSIQASRNTGVLFITHDIGVVAEIADRVMVMKSGEIVETGSTVDVLRNPRHPYTKHLIDAVPSMTPRDRKTCDQHPVVLETIDLCKTYKSSNLFGRKGQAAALKNVSLVLRKSEVLGIVGESGSGKTTVARSVARLIDWTSGNILIEGLDIAAATGRRSDELRCKVQIVFQDPYRSLNPRRTIGQSIVEGPVRHGVSPPKAAERARELLELVKIDPISMQRYPHQFSGGQRQRISIARALAMEPDILVADEVVSALDVSVQAQVLDLLDTVRSQFGLSILFITHDLRVAAQLCDKVAVMWKGEVVEYGSTKEVFMSPGHQYTRKLFDSIPGRGVIY